MSDFARQLEVFGDCGEMSREAVRPALFKAAARIRELKAALERQRDLLDECERVMTGVAYYSPEAAAMMEDTLAKLRKEKADE